ncbi:hypothetical protein LWI29_034583 [Acer saccharum]|uniref:Uncharacterized protein n=1 Tax=Acer saccharum TaxID=4024 RepID=A0AA39VUP6_ACESA|nr:hypothetical protein LWI29_034583 [Acer saccharum]
MLKRSLILDAELRLVRFPIPTMKHLSLNTQYVCNGVINAYIRVMSSCHYDLYGRQVLLLYSCQENAVRRYDLPQFRVYTIIVDIHEPYFAANISGIMKSGN